MANIINRASSGILKGINEVRSNQLVSTFYGVSKALTPKSMADGVSTLGGAVTDTLQGLSVSTPWRRKITRDRLSNAIYREQINPILEAVGNGISSLTQGLNQISSTVSSLTGAGALKGTTRGNRVIREVNEGSNLNNLSYYPSDSREENGYVITSPLSPERNSNMQVGDTIIEASKDKITEFRRSLQGKKNRPSIYIVNTTVSPYMYLELQTIPQSISYNPQTTWATLNSLGRNTPFYHYTGSEDTLTFAISWYCNDRARPDEVIAKCKLLESWSKSDGYVASPPILQIYIPYGGAQEMFNYGNEPDKYILWSAPYEYTGFKNSAFGSDVDETYFNKESRFDHTSDKVTPYAAKDQTLFKDYANHPIVPTVATQTLTFKRVSNHNLTHNDIVLAKYLEGISAIQTDKESNYGN